MDYKLCLVPVWYNENYIDRGKCKIVDINFLGDSLGLPSKDIYSLSDIDTITSLFNSDIELKKYIAKIDSKYKADVSKELKVCYFKNNRYYFINGFISRGTRKYLVPEKLISMASDLADNRDFIATIINSNRYEYNNRIKACVASIRSYHEKTDGYEMDRLSFEAAIRSFLITHIYTYKDKANYDHLRELALLVDRVTLKDKMVNVDKSYEEVKDVSYREGPDEKYSSVKSRKLVKDELDGQTSFF